jgi:hypothetical protein
VRYKKAQSHAESLPIVCLIECFFSGLFVASSLTSSRWFAISPVCRTEVDSTWIS